MKSLVDIATLFKKLNDMKEATNKSMPLIRATSTGITAFNIND